MRVTNIIHEDFVNYKKPSMFIGTCFCDGKCYKELNRDKSMCINNELAESSKHSVTDDELIIQYIHNPYSEAIVFGGLEPMLQIDEICKFLTLLRCTYECEDPVIIYTGYVPDEIEDQLNRLRSFKNIIVKFGRYVPDQNSRYDEVLGITLASDNQWAEQIS